MHAGVIEPGHFRFQCYGEQILHLEIMLGYQRRGVETLLPRRNMAQQLVSLNPSPATPLLLTQRRSVRLSRALPDVSLTLRDQAVRSVAAELERIAMHLSTLSGISTDIGFALPPPLSEICERSRSI